MTDPDDMSPDERMELLHHIRRVRDIFDEVMEEAEDEEAKKEYFEEREAELAEWAEKWQEPVAEDGPSVQ